MRKLFSVSVFLGLLFLLYPQTPAEVPQMINYQGKLTTAEGGCLNDTVQMIFSIYPDTLGSPAVWADTQAQVVVKDGVFNALLGSVNPIPDSVFDGSTKYLGVQVESDPEMRPLKPMVSVAYAYRALSCDEDWTFRITDTADTTLITGGQWGIARYGNILYGNADFTHVNLGIACTTGTSGQNYKYCTVGGGKYNTASGEGSTVGGGEWNTAKGSFHPTVGGGMWNTASAFGATVGGGTGNTASDGAATVGGGDNNTASAFGATVGGGSGNTASGDGAAVGGGMNNIANSWISTVGGGDSNTASDEGSTVGGGRFNTASGVESTVGGGLANTASGEFYSTIGGGVDNTAGASFSIVGGGENNIAGADYATVGGGRSNGAGFLATVGGGSDNTATGGYATIGGGNRNKANGDYATIPGGSADTVAGDFSFAAGNKVRLTGAADYTFAFGYNFTTSAPHAVVFYDAGTEMKLGIQTTSPTNILTVQENSATDPIADAWTTYSSKEYKRDIHELTPEDYRDALKKVVSVPVVKFHYKGEDTKEKIGVIAEDAPEEILAEGDNKAISLNEYISLLHAALKAQQEQIDALKGEIDRMKLDAQ